jgi:hypothetical protein
MIFYLLSTGRAAANGQRDRPKIRVDPTVAKISLMDRWNIKLDANFQPDLSM